ncbi:MAG: HIT family protein [Nitrospirales bacterium]|nr:HIT family protein [Nitrospirales bacterium]
MDKLPTNTLNATMKKFGAPGTQIKTFGRWTMLLRPTQVTLGSLVLICAEPATQFSQLSQDAFTELHTVTREIEQGLERAFAFDKINYLMLMMVDPDVHFHIFPRYADPKNFEGHEFLDHSWPGPPDLTRTNPTSPDLHQVIITHIQQNLAI